MLLLESADEESITDSKVDLICFFSNVALEALLFSFLCVTKICYDQNKTAIFFKLINPYL